MRGVGFATSVVAAGAVTAKLVPSDRRGEGLALVGVVGGIPGLLALPAGVWMAGHWGYQEVFVLTAAAPLLALLSVPGLPSRETEPNQTNDHGVLMRPATIFAASSVATGVLITFLPLATTGQPVWVASAGLLAHSAAATMSRWAAGRLGDRNGAGHLLAPGLAMATVGMATVAGTATPAAVVGGALVFGAGFGVLQNATLTLMFARVPAGCEGTVSAIWNAAYDLGMAAVALGAGLVVTSIDYPTLFILTALTMLPAFVLVRRDHRPSANNSAI